MASSDFDSQPQGEAERLLEQGKRADEVNRPEQAHEFYHQSLSVAQDLGDKRSEARALLALAHNAPHYCPEEDINAWDCQEWYARRSLEIFQEIGDREGVANSLYILAWRVEYQEAIQLLEESVAISREVGYMRGMVVGLVRLGKTVAINGNREQGLQFIRDALQIARDRDAKRLIAFVLFSLSVFTDDDRRLAWFDEAITIYRELGLKSALAEALDFAAMAHSEIGDVKTEEAYRQEALSIYRELDDAFREALCLQNLAKIARKCGDNERALNLEAQCRVDATPVVQPPQEEVDEFLHADRDGKVSFIKRWFG
jgi:tetratricopeptide (TPR) repeat protein